MATFMAPISRERLRAMTSLRRRNRESERNRGMLSDLAVVALEMIMSGWVTGDGLQLSRVNQNSLLGDTFR